MLTFAVGTFLMVAAAHSFVASFPTFRTYSSVLAGFGAVAVFLALEAAQRVGNVWVCIRQDYDLVRADYHAKRGRILRSNRRIEAIEPVLEYVGDLIDKDEAELREVDYCENEETCKEEKRGQETCNMFYFTFQSKTMVIDPTRRLVWVETPYSVLE